MLVRDNNLVTPHQLYFAYAGYSYEACPSLDLVPDVRVVDRSELYSADELFICGSAVEILLFAQLIASN